jgi:glycosyltransferase involved in cell wall biosynthesis
VARLAHFTTEFGVNAEGGVGTCVNELHDSSGPESVFVLLTASGAVHPASGRVVRSGFYDMDLIGALTFDAAVFHHYALWYLADETVLRGRKLIYVVHSVPTTEPWNFIQPYGEDETIPFCFEHMCDRADLIVCVSEAERGKLLLLYPDLRGKTCVIHNGLSKASPSQIANRWHRDRTTFGILGRCDYRKGLREAIAAVAHVQGASLAIACGEEDTEYRRLAQEDVRRLELADRVRWLGRVEGVSGKEAFFDEVDALVVPSRWEPFGYVVLEALRSGVPPLISTRGGMAEIVGKDYPYTFDPWDPDGLVQCMLSFQNDSYDFIRRVVRKAVRHSGHLTGERMAQEYEKLADELLAGKLPISPLPMVRRYGSGRVPKMMRSLSLSASATPSLPRLHKMAPLEPQYPKYDNTDDLE